MQIKKSRLMQIIKEELSRIEEVEVVRRPRSAGAEKEAQLFKDFIEAAKAGNEQESNALMNKLYPILKNKAVGYLSSKQLKTANSDRFQEFFHDKLISNILDNPDLIDPDLSLPSSFIMRSVWNDAISGYRRAIKHGGTPTVSGEITAMSDTAQEAGETLPTDIMGGSRFIPQDEKVIFKDIYKKLQKEDPTAAAAFGLSYMGHTNNEIGELLGVSQPTVSRAVNKAKELMSTMEEAKSIEEISMNPGGYGSGVYGKTSAAARETGEKENDRQARILDELPKGHTEVPGDKLKQKPFAGKLEEVIAEVVSELMS